jgi:hypothetical protein
VLDQHLKHLERLRPHLSISCRTCKARASGYGLIRVVSVSARRYGVQFT